MSPTMLAVRANKLVRMPLTANCMAATSILWVKEINIVRSQSTARLAIMLRYRLVIM